MRAWSVRRGRARRALVSCMGVCVCVCWVALSYCVRERSGLRSSGVGRDLFCKDIMGIEIGLLYSLIIGVV